MVADPTPVNAARPDAACTTGEPAALLRGDDAGCAIGPPTTFHHGDFPAAPGARGQGRAGRTVSVCIPARDEGSTVGSVVRAVVQPFLAAGGRQRPGRRGPRGRRRLDRRHRRAGPRAPGPGSWPAPGGPGARARPWRAALAAAARRPGRLPRRRRGQHDARPSSPGCSGPLLTTDDVALVKGFYTRPLHGDPDRRRPGHRAGGPPGARPALPRAGRGAPAPGRRDGRPPLGLREAAASPTATGSSSACSSTWPSSFGAGPPGPGRPRGAHPPQPAAARAAAPGRRRAAGRARARPVLARRRAAPCAAEPARVSGHQRHHRRLEPRARSPSAPVPTARSSPVPGGRRPGLVAAPAPGRQRHDLGLGDDGGGGPRGRRPGPACSRTGSTSSRSSSTTTPTGRPTTSSPTPRCGTATTTSSTCRAGPGSTATGARPGRATGPTTGPWPTS